jgi:FkbM family methyltransferase
LIYDVGLHEGGDTAFYLANGFRVVAIDADQHVIETARERFRNEVSSGRLTLVHCAVLDREPDDVSFFLSETPDWNSLDPSIAGRRSPPLAEIRVRSRRLDSLFEEYGVPVYCKIDIEGADALALKGLVRAKTLPQYISVEAECAGRERWSQDRSIETLELLFNLGYTQFKLVDQPSLTVLPPSTRFYFGPPPIWKRALRRLGFRTYTYWSSDDCADAKRMAVCHASQYSFTGDVTGPWGEMLTGHWLDYAAARRSYLQHRLNYYSQPSANAWGFWVDWHATR